MNNLKTIIISGIILITITLLTCFIIVSTISTSNACPCQENEQGEKETLEIFYPQVCQLTIPDLEETDKQGDFFNARWQVKTIYDAVPHQINADRKSVV